MSAPFPAAAVPVTRGGGTAGPGVEFVEAVMEALQLSEVNRNGSATLGDDHAGVRALLR